MDDQPERTLQSGRLIVLDLYGWYQPIAEYELLGTPSDAEVDEAWRLWEEWLGD